MIWQHIIVFQIVASSIMTIWYRIVSLKHPNNPFTLSVIVYCMVAFVGAIVGILHNGGQLPNLPDSRAAMYIIGEGILIPTSWLVQYRLLTIVGASSAAIAGTINFLTVALLGCVFLGDQMNVYLVVGGSFLITGVILSLSSGNMQAQSARILTKIILLVIGSITLGFGLLFEKLAIDSMGVWSYALYGWLAQLLGALCIYIFFGIKELRKRPQTTFIVSAGAAGLLTALAGSLFIYTLSKGLLSSVVLASSAKVALTSLIAFWILKERDNLPKRMGAFGLSILGLVVIFGA